MEQRVEGAPDVELTRSPAASVVGREAARAQLLLAHFEYRAGLDVPEQWLPEGRPDLGSPQSWRNGILPESKYTSFRNDMMIGSFHPGHRAKWTAHELCHGLVGFAWRPDATPFYHALAARLAELLPVAVFYFFDEIQLNRCELHNASGPLFGSYCRDCEQAAKTGPDTKAPDQDRFRREGLAFIERELAAVSKSLKLGRPVPSPWANLDLCSDGLAYAAAQGPRLQSQQFCDYIQLFFPEHTGRHETLEALEDRIRRVTAVILDDQPLEPWAGDRWTRVAQDLGWRLLEISAQCEREVADALTEVAARLAAQPSDSAVMETITGYEALHEEYVLPHPDDVFALGYLLPGGYGYSTRQIAEGIASACPNTWDALGRSDEDSRMELVRGFMKNDPLERTPLGIRFARWLADAEPEPAARAAMVEAGMTHAPAADAASLTLGMNGARDTRLRLDPAVQIIRTDAAAAVMLGLATGEETATRPIWLAVRRDASGELVVLNLSEDLGTALEALEQSPLTKEELKLEDDLLEILIQSNLVCPVAWHT
ncbi:MAG: hypothetical protein QNK37_14430 [Acidobacteriota bacterium]|nr:hypothetical protein [Acidobacteriota bacterium]